MASALKLEELGELSLGIWGDNTSCPTHGVTYDTRFNDLGAHSSLTASQRDGSRSSRHHLPQRLYTPFESAECLVTS